MKRWRKQPNERGLAAVCQSKRGAELRDDGEILAHVSSSHCGGWYWYGFGQNTHASPVATIDEAKAEVNQYVKENNL